MPPAKPSPQSSVPDLVREMPVRALDCLKQLYRLEERSEPRVTTSGMRQWLQRVESDGRLSDATITALFKYLEDSGLVTYEPYRGVAFTDRGRRAAAHIVRRHRLIELFLERELGYGWEEVHDEADRLEHSASDLMIERIAAKYAGVTADPHGNPIPDASGIVTPSTAVRLSTLGVGQDGIVRQVSDDERETLRYLRQTGLVPGALVTMVRYKTDFDEMFLVTVTAADRSSHEERINERVARQVFVDLA
jgi:DtxR family transcriptional regulator, Mn-dependent transcriptional regulator